MRGAGAVIVVGGGIGGLAAGLALARRGARVRVFERAARIGEFGAGVQISPNGRAVLEALGVADAVTRTAVRGAAVRLRDGAGGRDVLRLDLAAAAAGGREFLFVHRADLVAALLEAAVAAGVEIETGREVIGLEAAGGEAAGGEAAGGEAAAAGACGATGGDGREAPRLRMADGSVETAAFVVGADGVHSRLRQAVDGPSAPFFTGQVAWRAVVPAEGDPAPEVSVFMGPGRHLVRYPLRGGRLLNVVAVEERAGWTAEGWHHRDDPERLRAAFCGFAPEVRDLLARVEEVFLWGLFRHPVAERWHRGRVALLGDAAHPTLPFLAQGANLALEDAWVLARALAGDAPEAALARYQRARRDRVVRAIAAANANARNYHLRQPLLRALAHGGLRLAGRLFPGAALGRFEWLYGHDVTRA